MARKIGLLTADGETAATNSLIQGVLLGAMGDEVIGFLRGWAGLLSPEKEYRVRYRGPTADPVRTTTRRGEKVPLIYTPSLAAQGGTILKTSRTNPGVMDGGYEDVAAAIRAEGLDVLVVIGELDSFRVARELKASGLVEGVGIVVIPNTINNDIGTTADSLDDVTGVWTMGFPSAVRNGRDHLSLALSTVVSKERVYWLEAMGRDAGWLALGIGCLAGADMVLVPEYPVDMRPILNVIRREYASKGYFVGVIAEGFPDPLFPGVPLAENPDRRDAFGRPAIAGAASKLVQKLTREAASEPFADHIQSGQPGYAFRGGSPLPVEVGEGTALGVYATSVADPGEIRVVSLKKRGDEIVPMATSLEEAATTKDGAFTARRIPRNGFYDEKTLNVSDAGRSYFDLMGLYKLPFLVR